jgi:hypothetical protein
LIQKIVQPEKSIQEHQRMSNMISAITNHIRKIASLKMIGLFFLLYLISFMIIGSKSLGTARLKEMTGGVSIPDVEMLGYSPQRVYDILTAQGEAGRAFYLHDIMPQDIPLPAFYSLFFATFLTYLAQRLLRPDHPLQHIGLIGLCAGLADWAENLCFLSLLLHYPQRLDALARLANAFTLAKTSLALLSLALILLGLGWLLAKTLRAKIPVNA